MIRIVLILTCFFAVSIGAAQTPEDQNGAEPIPKLPDPGIQPQLPPSAEMDEPVIFQQEGVTAQPKLLEQQTIEEKPAVLLEKDKPDYIPLFFDPERNGVIYGRQEIEYDLTNPLILRVGPLSVTAAGVVMRMSRELGKVFEFDFGAELKERYANMYMISFQWPVDLVPDGVIELFDDAGNVLWRRDVNAQEVADWRGFVSQRKVRENSFELKPTEKAENAAFVKERLKVTGHDQSHFGLFGRDIFEIPVWKFKQPFRFCVTKDAPEGRIAICSKRYRFSRKGGRYWVVAESKNIKPKILVNDEPVTMRGSAIFIDDRKPIKFAALLGNGTYFEFVSFPKRITIVDMVLNEDTNEVEVLGYGPPPLGDISRVVRKAPEYWDFLNFLPTIGDFRQFWKATFPARSGSLYLRGYGGAPFKQPFLFERLPRKTTRPRIHIKSPKSTYVSNVRLRGETTDPISVSSKETWAKNLTNTEFEWEFLARERGEMNRAEIQVKDGEHTYTAFHEVYKGFPRELSARVTGVLTSDLELVVLGELATQWWLEKIFGSRHPKLSLQRWGIAAKYFQALASIGGSTEGQSLIKLQVINADLKYRITSGIWGRDHTLGIKADFQSVVIEEFQAQMAGVGVFWARSMPKVFDEVFNIIPFLRYPKWVDMEVLVYPLALNANNSLGLNTALNFHGKILWTPRFFGEGGFGLKTFQFADYRQQQEISLAMAYATNGLGFNF